MAASDLPLPLPNFDDCWRSFLISFCPKVAILPKRVKMRAFMLYFVRIARTSQEMRAKFRFLPKHARKRPFLSKSGHFLPKSGHFAQMCENSRKNSIFGKTCPKMAIFISRAVGVTFSRSRLRLLAAGVTFSRSRLRVLEAGVTFLRSRLRLLAAGVTFSRFLLRVLAAGDDLFEVPSQRAIPRFIETDPNVSNPCIRRS